MQKERKELLLNSNVPNDHERTTVTHDKIYDAKE